MDNLDRLIQREAGMIKLRDTIETRFCDAQSSGRRIAKEYRSDFMAAFELERADFKALKSKPNATSSEYDRHFKRAQALLDKYMDIFNRKYNEGRNAFFMTREEAARQKEVVKQKLRDQIRICKDYNTKLRTKYGNSQYYYHNADKLITEIDNDIQERVDTEFYRVSHVDQAGYAEYVRKLYYRLNGYAYRLKSIKGGAPFDVDW